MRAEAYSKGELIFFGVLSLLFGGGALHYSTLNHELPPRTSLQTATGVVDWTETGKYGVKFGFVGDPRAFDYASKNNAKDQVENALKSANGAAVHVLYDESDPGGTIYSKAKYYPVYEISVSARLIRSLEQVRTARRADDGLAIWIGLAFVMSGTYLLYSASRQAQST